MEKRSFIVLYDTKWNTPNGDPFTGEQRYDSSNGLLMLSDVRFKRYSKDALNANTKEPIFGIYDSNDVRKVIDKYITNSNDGTKGIGNITGAAFSLRSALVKAGILSDINKYDKKELKNVDMNEFIKKFLDVRLYGGIFTEDGVNLSLEGAVQIKNMNYSLNKVKREVLQNTTIFPSKISNQQGSIGTSIIIPYAIIGVEGWLNEQTAKINNVTEMDIDMMLSSFWLGIRDKNTRSKSGQTPIAVIEIVYQEKEYKFNPEISVYKPIQNPLSLITIKTDMDEIDIRCREDYTLQLEKFISECDKDNVKVVNFYTEDDVLKKQFVSCSKFKFKELY